MLIISSSLNVNLKLGELKLGEMLDTPPPELDEAIAISKACVDSLAFNEFRLTSLTSRVFYGLLADVLIYCQVIQFLESQEYNIFTRIVFDTAPTVRQKVNLLCRFILKYHFLNLVSILCRVIHYDFCPCQTSWMHL